MGRDIHMLAQHQDSNGTWVTDKTALYTARDSSVFDVLACGDPDDPVYQGAPISRPKGLPSDHQFTVKEGTCMYDAAFFIGEHSFSYLTLNELESFDWNQAHLHFKNQSVAEGSNFGNVLSYLRGLSTQHGGPEKVRIVFGFDS